METNIKSLGIQVSQTSQLGYFQEGRGYTFSQLLKKFGKRQISEINVEEIRPKQFKRQGRWNQNEFVDYCRKNNITVMDPSEYYKLPQMISIEAQPDYFPNAVNYINDINPDFKPSDKFPNLGVKDRYPSYIPTYLVEKYDNDLFRMGFDILLHGNLPDEVAINIKEAMLTLSKVTHDFYLGNGTLQGQLGRHKAVMEVHDKVKFRKFDVENSEENVTMWMNIMNERFPLNQNEIILDKHPSLLKDYHHELIAIQNDSDAGIIWSKGSAVTKRISTTGVDFDIADTMYSSCVKLSGAEDVNSSHSEFWEAWDFARIVKIKNKTEVYSNEEFLTKTRNYFATNSGTQIMAQMLLLGTHHELKTFLDSPNIWNMIGWTGFHGGMDKYMNCIKDRKEQFSCTYADNIYTVSVDKLTGELWYHSLDGTKMEATIQLSEIVLEAIRSLNHFKDFDKAWESFAVNVFGNLCINLIGVIGGNQIFLPYMGSGIQGTAYNNETKSILFLHFLRQDGEQIIQNRNGIIDFTEAEDQAGVSFKQESNINFKDLFTNGKDNEIKVDVLGMSAFECSQIGLPGRFMPVLEASRLYKGLAFMKMHIPKGAPEMLRYGLMLFRLRAFYFIGAWKHPGLADLIQLACLRLSNVEGLDLEIDWNKEWKDTANSVGITLEVNEEDIKTYFNKKGVPTLYEVVKLGLGQLEAFDFANYVFENYEEPWAYMPAQVFDELNQIYDLKIPDDMHKRMVNHSYIENVLEKKELPKFSPVENVITRWGYGEEIESSPEDFPVLKEQKTLLDLNPELVREKLKPSVLVNKPLSSEVSVEALRDPFEKINKGMYLNQMNKDIIRLYGDRFTNIVKLKMPIVKDTITVVLTPNEIEKIEKNPPKKPYIIRKRFSNLLATLLGIPSIFITRMALPYHFLNVKDNPNFKQYFNTETVEPILKDPAFQRWLVEFKREEDVARRKLQLSQTENIGKKEKIETKIESETKIVPIKQNVEPKITQSKKIKPVKETPVKIINKEMNLSQTNRQPQGPKLTPLVNLDRVPTSMQKETQGIKALPPHHNNLNFRISGISSNFMHNVVEPYIELTGGQKPYEYTTSKMFDKITEYYYIKSENIFSQLYGRPRLNVNQAMVLNNKILTFLEKVDENMGAPFRSRMEAKLKKGENLSRKESDVFYSLPGKGDPEQDAVYLGYLIGIFKRFRDKFILQLQGKLEQSELDEIARNEKEMAKLHKMVSGAKVSFGKQEEEEDETDFPELKVKPKTSRRAR